MKAQVWLLTLTILTLPALIGSSGAQKAMLSLHSRNAGDPGTEGS